MTHRNKQLPLVNFQSIMKEIIFDEWNESKFSKAKLERIYAKVKNLKVDQFKAVAGEIYDLGGFLPTPKTFAKHSEVYLVKNNNDAKEEHNSDMKNLFNNQELQDFAKVFSGILNGNTKALKVLDIGLSKLSHSKCKHCNDSGIIHGIRKKRTYETNTFNCFCPGTTENPCYPTWGTRFDDEFINRNMRSIA